MEPKILRFQEAARWCRCCWPKNHHLSSKALGQLGAGPRGGGVGRDWRGIILEPGFVQGGRWEESRQGPGWAEGE